VATENKEIKHECRYVGPHESNPPESIDLQPASPSPVFARSIALEILGGRIGRYRSSKHFQDQMADRDFDVFDMEYAIRNGKCIKGGEFCKDLRNHKYTFRANIEGNGFDAVFALSADHDFVQSPLMTLITGCFKTSTGKRGKTY